jgi:hypothetical protein
MTLYSVALFVHIIGALLLFAAFTSEGISLFHLRRATTNAEARQWEGVAGLGRILGPPSVVTILASGLYMLFSTWGWVPWIAVGLIAWFLVAVMGAINGIRLSLTIRHTAADPNALSRLRAPAFVVSWLTRLAIGVGIVFVMTSKPGLVWAIICIAIASAVGVVAGMLVARQTALNETTTRMSYD